MGIGKVTNIKQVQMNKKLDQPNKKKHKKGEKGLSFSDVLRSVTH